MKRPRSKRILVWRSAIGDLVAGFDRRWMWQTLAIQDIKSRYRGSILGPFWVTINTAILVVALGSIYPRVLGIPADGYIPYLTIGLVIWTFISSTVTEGCNSFVSQTLVIKQVRLPFSVHAFRSVLRNLIVFAHSLIVLPFVMLAFSVPLKLSMLAAILGIIALAINGLWVTLLLGMCSARFRDIPPLVTNALSIIFFVTPIFWHVDALGPATWFIDLNPFFAAIDVVRSPLLGEPTSRYSWPILLFVTAIGCATTFVVFAQLRPRIPYWV